MLVVRLAMTKPLLAATSNPGVTTSNSDDDAVAPSYFETKGITDVNIWDDEW